MIGVCIVTYNQEDYIAQALDSVLAQRECPETIRVYIGNDCSTDRTYEICLEYSKRFPDSIRLLNNQKNIGLVNNTVEVLKSIIKDGCNYIAMLDGDDYWCDPFKLRKQLCFLYEHPDYGFIHTRSYLLYNDNGVLVKPKLSSPPCGNVLPYISTLPIANCTVLFSSKLLETIDLNALAQKGFLSLDYVMYVLFSTFTNFGFLEDYTAVWRRGHTSVSNTNDEAKQIKYLENDKAMWKYLGELFPDRFCFKEDYWNEYYYNKVFNIAYRFKDYSLAHSLLPRLNKKGSTVFRIKKLCATNYILFSIWSLLKFK